MGEKRYMNHFLGNYVQSSQSLNFVVLFDHDSIVYPPCVMYNDSVAIVVPSHDFVHSSMLPRLVLPSQFLVVSLATHGILCSLQQASNSCMSHFCFQGLWRSMQCFYDTSFFCSFPSLFWTSQPMSLTLFLDTLDASTCLQYGAVHLFLSHFLTSVVIDLLLCLFIFMVILCHIITFV